MHAGFHDAGTMDIQVLHTRRPFLPSSLPYTGFLFYRYKCLSSRKRNTDSYWVMRYAAE